MPFDVKTNSLEQYWLPFTDNKSFKEDPRIITKASGVYVNRVSVVR